MLKLVLSVLAVTFLNISCTTELEYQEGDNLCYDLCLQKGKYVKVDTEKECICTNYEYVLKDNR